MKAAIRDLYMYVFIQLMMLYLVCSERYYNFVTTAKQQPAVVDDELAEKYADL